MKKRRTKLGTMLRTTRRGLDLTLEEVSSKTGIAASYLSDLESGTQADNPSLKTIRLLTRLYRLEPAQWFESEDTK